MNDRFRSFEPRHHGKGPNGRRLCVWCGTEVPQGKRTWCSQQCVKSMTIEHWPAAWSQAVIERDKGVCQQCGFDGRLVERVLRRLNWDYERHESQNSNHRQAHQWYQHHIWDLGFTRGIHLMQADHIIPVVDGGPNTLANGRTLCQPCHKAETARLARRRKWDRRAKKRGLLFAMHEEP
jgi:5-methylcytosine-specific restriction protein A